MEYFVGYPKEMLYLLGITMIYLVAAFIDLHFAFVDVIVVQIGYLVLLMMPLVWPWFGKKIGVDSFWGNYHV